jgi:hypothetical protein
MSIHEIGEFRQCGFAFHNGASPNPFGLRDAARENVRWRIRRCSTPIRHGENRLARPQPLVCME